MNITKKWFDGDAPVNAAYASVATEFSTANAEMILAGKYRGIDFNDWTVNLIDPSGNNKALSVEVDNDNKEINISLATGAEGAITSKAEDIKDLIEAHEVASNIISVAYAEDNTGEGVVGEAELVLDNGVDGTVCQDNNVIVEDGDGQLYINILPNSRIDANWRKLNLVAY